LGEPAIGGRQAGAQSGMGAHRPSLIRRCLRQTYGAELFAPVRKLLASESRPEFSNATSPVFHHSPGLDPSSQLRIAIIVIARHHPATLATFLTQIIDHLISSHHAQSINSDAPPFRPLIHVFLFCICIASPWTSLLATAVLPTAHRQTATLYWRNLLYNPILQTMPQKVMLVIIPSPQKSNSSMKEN